MRLRTHTNPFHFYKRMEKINLPGIFPHYSGILDIEIGFGTGLFGRQWAKQHPDRCMIGLEIRKEAVAVAIKRTENEDLSNLHLIHGKGEIFLEDCLEDNVVDKVFIFHPDPWFKHYHHKRRVIQVYFLEILKKKLKETGLFYLSTDVPELWTYMMSLITKSGLFVLIEDPLFWSHFYQTEWQGMSKNRSQFYGTFKKIILEEP